MKRTVAIILAFILVVGTAAAGFTSFASAGDEMPLIYIAGYGCPIYFADTDPDDHNNWIYPVVKDSDQILGYVTENKDILIDAIITQDWSEFDDKLYEIMSDMFKDLKLGKDGMPDNNTIPDVDYSDNHIRSRYLSDSSDPNDWEYHYDWRLDPFDNMEQLHDYIQRILRITGTTEYAIAGRCLGANLALAYMEKYKDPALKKVIFYASAAQGVNPIGEIFSGKLKINADSAELLLYNTEFGLNYDLGGFLTVTDEVLREIVTDLNNICGLDVAAFCINNVYHNIYKDIIPRTMRDTLGSFPGYWSMVGNEYYDDAKALIFGGMEEEYSEFIKRIDYFHETVGLRNDEIIKEAQERGTEVFNIVKYGIPMYPVSERGKDVGDGFCTVRDASFGATACKIDKTFNKRYLKKAAQDGTDKYISPDNRIDASTSFLRDTTWFVNNSVHDDFYIKGDEELIHLILQTEGFNINTDERYPQYLFYDEENDAFRAQVSDDYSVVDTWYEATDTLARKMRPFFRPFYFIIIAFIKLGSLRLRYYT